MRCVYSVFFQLNAQWFSARFRTTSSIWMRSSMPMRSSSPPGGGVGISRAFRNSSECLVNQQILPSYLFGLTFCCCCCSCACSASLALRSFSFNENMATDRARLIRLCLMRCFFASNSAPGLSATHTHQ